MAVDERTFVSKVESWVDAILARRQDLPYSKVLVEDHLVGSRKRLDFELLRRGSERIALTGEVKMPDQPYGKSPWTGEVLEDAFEKASRLGAPFYFTWNVNHFVLFRTHEDNVPFTERNIDEFEVVKIDNSDQVWREDVQAKIKEFWERLLDRLAGIERGESFRNLPLDQRFIKRLEGALVEPIATVSDFLRQTYVKDGQFREAINRWMRDDQGWEISRTTNEENLERAARLSCYVLANRLVFYEVLRRRFPALRPVAKLAELGAQELAGGVKTFLQEAIHLSRDYETIFRADDFGATLPLLSEEAAQMWRYLIKGIADFDFTKLDYDVIGRMYENLIGPPERKKYGQFFTAPQVVDLINAFCIREHEARVMDPACGGGTFLVRAYARKKALAARKGKTVSHQTLLGEIFGIDIAGFPAQLATINLAVRQLAAEANYPQVVQRDFFSVFPGMPVDTLPVGSNGAEVDVVVQGLDAVVGNPPYIRQEDLSRQEKGRLTALLNQQYRGPGKPKLSGRSDLYAYFFPHGAAFLKEGGYLGLITSVGWLDTEYGFRLQEFLLSNFRIIAVIESQVEKWFEDARVTTAVTILQKESRELRRRNNLVRFIQLRRPLREIYTSALKGPVNEADEAARQADMDAFRDLIEEITENQSTDYWRVRVVGQGVLWDRGVNARVGPEDLEAGAEANSPRYRAGKWGQYLRAPDIYFELLDRCQARFVPMYEIAEVRFGFKSGADKFFCVRDTTEEELKRTPSEAEFRQRWGIGRSDTGAVRIVRDGDRAPYLVEKRFLEPEFHRLTDATRIVVTTKDVKKLVINASVPPATLRRTHLGKFVTHAERQGWNTGSTVASRAKARPWYDLGLAPKNERAQMFWSKSHQYRHLVVWNEDQLPGNCNLYDTWALQGVDSRLLWALLNSTVVALTKHQFGRAAGIEGNLKTEVVDVKMTLVPDPRGLPEVLAKRAVAAAETLAKRPLARMLPEEFELADRIELDDSVLEILGIGDPYERKALLKKLYSALDEMYHATRAREVVAQKDRLRSKRKGVVTALDLAQDIWDGESPNLALQEFPADFVRTRRGRPVGLPSGKVEVGRALMEAGGHLRAGTIRVDGSVINVGTMAHAEFLAAAASCGAYGPIMVPDQEADCQAAVDEFQKYCTELEAQFKALAAQRTRDTKKQKAIVEALMRMARSWRRGQTE